MTALAVKQLSQNEKGYFLLVEAGRIDHAHLLKLTSLTDTVARFDAVRGRRQC